MRVWIRVLARVGERERSLETLKRYRTELNDVATAEDNKK